MRHTEVLFFLISLINLDDFEGQPVKRFQDGIYNFELVDVKTGLFAYASGGYYSCLRFGYAKLSSDSIKFAS